MNNSELVSKISTNMNLPKKEVEELLSAAVKALTQEFSEGKTVGIQSFGSFEVRKREERISVHPLTQARTLIPPKLVLNFRQSNILKDKIKDLKSHE